MTSVNLVATKPGAIPFTLILFSAQASAQVFIKVSKPPFEAEYAGLPFTE